MIYNQQHLIRRLVEGGNLSLALFLQNSVKACAEYCSCVCRYRNVDKKPKWKIEEPGFKRYTWLFNSEKFNEYFYKTGPRVKLQVKVK